ncbi:MAG: alpha/beta fold hydrolase [Clostridia bacterium]|nr:alpha/beta fold hydrolase [Clostridia bacterium]
MSKTKKRVLIAIISILAVVVLLASAFFIYAGVYYHTDKEAVNAYLASKPSVTETKLDGDYLAYSNGENKAGIVFYPGAKVEYTAYSPLMCALAEKGFYCVLVKMPFNLAFLKPNAANSVVGSLGIEHWYIAGHSLGGSFAAQYAAKNTEKLDGLILLGSYSATDLSSTNLKVLSVYGSEDKVLNKKNYDKNKSKLPSDFLEFVIDGGCHSGFGMYGAQKGDGTPTIPTVEQIELTANYISNFADSADFADFV